jgi:ABC-type Fe3+-siderophore transport system permease subunit
MSYKLLFVLNAVVAVACGLLLLFAPEVGLAQFNMTARVQEVFMARAIGAALASLGVLLWFAKDADGAAQTGLGIAALTGSVLALIVTIMGIFSVVKGLGWVAVVVEFIFGLGYAFLLFLQPKMK